MSLEQHFRGLVGGQTHDVRDLTSYVNLTSSAGVVGLIRTKYLSS